jgi:hypothetical protein
MSSLALNAPPAAAFNVSSRYHSFTFHTSHVDEAYKIFVAFVCKEYAVSARLESRAINSLL